MLMLLINLYPNGFKNIFKYDNLVPNNHLFFGSSTFRRLSLKIKPCIFCIIGSHFNNYNCKSAHWSNDNHHASSFYNNNQGKFLAMASVCFLQRKILKEFENFTSFLQIQF